MMSPQTTNNEDRLRIASLGLSANLGMAIVKVIGGWILRSQTLRADGLHSLADSIADMTTMVVIALDAMNLSPTIAGAQLKVENLGAAIIGMVVLVGGILLGKEALEPVLSAMEPVATNLHAVWFALASIAIKEMLYQKTMEVARRTKSTALAANAAHHRLDSFSSILSLTAIVVSHVYPAARLVDVACALFVSTVVVKEGFGVIYESGREIASTLGNKTN